MIKTSVFVSVCVGLFLAVGALVYAVHPAAARNNSAALAVCDQFLDLMKAHQYARAQALCAASYRDSVPLSTMQTDWEGVEGLDGPVKGFSAPWGVWDTILPTSVEATWWLRCTKGRGHISLHLVPEGGTWRINGVHAYQW